MRPVVALVGRPNVGKSTLFNVLTRSRDALVADHPGLTRDRKYGIGRVGDADYLVVDTGGLGLELEALDERMARQTAQAVQEADAVVFLVDAREGLTARDEEIAQRLRESGKPVVLAVNKTDGLDVEQALSEFYRLGIAPVVPIAAAHGRGVHRLVDAVMQVLPEEIRGSAVAEREVGAGEGIRIAFVGRPNVGKSTLINRLLGEERLVTLDRPGTTRDTVEVPFEREGRRYVLIDTAGVRRRARVREAVEKFSVIKSLQAAERADVVVMVLDAREGVTEQDATLLGLVLEMGRAVVLVVNKWDGLTAEQKARVRAGIARRLGFLDFCERIEVSALHGTGVGLILPAVQRADQAARFRIPTPELNRLLEQAVAAHQPPMSRGRRIKLRYAHQVGIRPPTIVVYGTQATRLPAAYRRYLINTIRKTYGLVGSPIRLELRSAENPFAGRRNKLTPRQQRKRQRLMRHVKQRRRR
ncbi:MAG TPA: ribosome biogenesis GTPase Der [Chromatiales bacterium]|nr:ribosome biogenesis GTPase Der [Chromatiales bacterium]